MTPELDWLTRGVSATSKCNLKAVVDRSLNRSSKIDQLGIKHEVLERIDVARGVASVWKPQKKSTYMLQVQRNRWQQKR